MTFKDWFDELENYSFRSERFYAEVDAVVSGHLKYDVLIKWLESAYDTGADKYLIENENLKKEVETWVNHTKQAVWADSEMCKILTEENEKLNTTLRIAAGLISTMPEHSNKHPQDVLDWLLSVAEQERKSNE